MNSNLCHHPSLYPAEPAGKERHPSLQPPFFLPPSLASGLLEQTREDMHTRALHSGCSASGRRGSQGRGQHGSRWWLPRKSHDCTGHPWGPSLERGWPPRRPCPLQVRIKDWEASLVKISCNRIIRPYNVEVKVTGFAVKFPDPNPVPLSHLGL